MSNEYLPIIGITMGDPSGIGPEIMVKAVASANLQKQMIPLLIGDLGVLQNASKIVGLEFNPVIISGVGEINSDNPDGSYYLLDLKNVSREVLELPGNPDSGCGQALVDYIKVATRLALSKDINAVVTCPINKEVMNSAGYNYPGHTEFLAELTDTKKFAMMMVGGGLNITLLTIHTSIQSVPALVTHDAIIEAIELTDSFMKRCKGLKSPVIGVAGLNPHAGEGGMFGKEDIEIIAPAIEAAQACGINVSGPHPADTLFYRAIKKEFDAVIVMYHDQGLIPLKTVAFDTGVNVTIGLPIIRTSVDHGTAYDLAGTGKASDSSLQEAMALATDFAKKQEGSEFK